MVYGIGTDIVEIARIKKAMEIPRFGQRVFSPRELEYFSSCHNPHQSAAANFCGKEAFGKALGTGVSGFSLVEVEIVRDTLGKPVIELSGSAKDIATKLGIEVSITLSHCKDYAVAFVIATKKTN